MSTDATANRNAWRWTWVVAMLPFVGTWITGLYDVDEGFYAAIIRQMLTSGDWIIPRYNGLPWFEKPILLYWLAAPLTAVFGDALGPRLGSVLCGAGTMAAVGWFMRRRFDDVVARRSVIILATTMMFVAVNRMLLADPPLVLFLSLAIIFFAESVLGNPRLRAASGLCLGLAVLAKGPVSVFIFVVIVGWLAFSQKSMRPAMKGGWLGFVALFVAAICAWYVPAYLRAPKEFVDIFVMEQNVERLLGGDDAHRVPGLMNFIYYPLVLLVTAAPWWWHALKGWKAKEAEEPNTSFVRSLLQGWTIVILVLFTISGSKLPHYITPMIIPVAMLAAIRLGPVDRKKSTALGALAVSFGGAFAMSWLVNSIQLLQYYNSGQGMAHSFVRYAKSENMPLAVYQLRARERKVGFQPRVQETSLPSVNFYYGKPPIDAEDLETLFMGPTPMIVLTRPERITKDDVARAKMAGFDLIRIKEAQTTDPYYLYWLGPEGTYVPDVTPQPPRNGLRGHPEMPVPSKDDPKSKP